MHVRFSFLAQQFSHSRRMQRYKCSGASKYPRSLCLLLAGSLRHKDSWLPSTERSYIGAKENAGYISLLLQLTLGVEEQDGPGVSELLESLQHLGLADCGELLHPGVDEETLEPGHSHLHHLSQVASVACNALRCKIVRTYTYTKLHQDIYKIRIKTLFRCDHNSKMYSPKENSGFYSLLHKEKLRETNKYWLDLFY